MKLKKKIVFLLLAVFVVMSVFPSGGQQPAAQAPGQITLSFFSWAGPYTKNGENNYFWKKMEQVTGIKTIVEMVPQASFAEQLNLRWASNSLADVLLKAWGAGFDLPSFAFDGALKPIGPYLKTNAPNLSKYMNENPDIERNIKLSDGNIYGFPYLVTASTTSPKLFYNKKWLDTTGKPVPTTTAELKALAQLFLDSDWNKNGQKDEIPIYVAAQGHIYKTFAGSFGMTAAGSYTDEWDIQNGKLYYIYTSNQGRNLLQYVNDLYVNKLIGQEFFTSDIPKFSAEANQNRVAFAFVHNSMYMDKYQDDFAALPGPFKGPDGTLNYTGFTNYIQGQGGFITKNNKYPAESVKWIDYLYSDEGIRLYFMGEQGVTWEFDSKGNPQFTSLVRNNPNGLGMEEVIGPYVVWSGGGNPSVADAKHFANHLLPKVTADAMANVAAYRPKQIWGPFPFTKPDQERLSILSTDINTYMAEQRAKFIRGEANFNTWSTYVQALEQMGLKEYTEIMQRGYDAYSK